MPKGPGPLQPIEPRSQHRLRAYSAWERRIGVGCTALLLAIFAATTWTAADHGFLGPRPDAFDYAYGAQALLQGRYTVDWDGAPRVPLYTPGTSLLMAPLVAIGGVGAATRLGSLSGVLAGLLVAVCAWRLARPAVAPLGVFFVLATPAALATGPLAMSDLPTAALLTLEATLLMRPRTVAIVAAGVIGGYLVWMRPSSLVLLGAALIGLSAFPMWKRSSAVYMAAALPLLAGLAVWQWATLGSPVLTGYQSAIATPDHSGSLGSLFSPDYLLGQPRYIEGGWANGPLAKLHVPNALAYALHLTSVDGLLIPPGIGLLGLLGLLAMARQRGASAALGRFGLAAGALLLCVYSVYFYQSFRFVLPIVPFLAIGASWSLMHAAYAWRGFSGFSTGVISRLSRAS